MNTPDSSNTIKPLLGSIPYTSDQFVAREAAVDLIRQKINSRQGDGSIQRSIVEIYSSVGQGKSWVLQHISKHFKQNDPEATSFSTHTPLTAQIDLGQFQTRKDARYLLLTLTQQLLEQLSDEASDLDLLHLIESAKTDDEAAHKLARFVRDLASKWVPLLLFDTTDAAEELFLDWLEEELVYSAVRDDTAIFVFTGRRRLRWKLFEVRRRVEPYELPPFDRLETGRQVEKLSSDKNNTLFNYSFGHPLTTRAIYEALLQFDSDTPLGAIAEHEEEIQRVVREVIDSVLSRTVSREELRKLLWMTCIVRLLNVNVLREFASGEATGRSEAYYLDAIRDLVASTLVHWDSNKGGYVLDSVIRRIMDKNLWMEDTRTYAQLHRKAAEMYERWISMYPRGTGDYLFEQMYHLGSALEAEAAPEIEKEEILIEAFAETLSLLERDPEVAWDLPDIALALEDGIKQQNKELLHLIGSRLEVLLFSQARSFIEKVGAIA